jgi:hypothetical protein
MSEKRIRNESLREVLIIIQEILIMTQKIIVKLKKNAQDIIRALKVIN